MSVPAFPVGAGEASTIEHNVPREVSVVLIAHGREVRRFTASPGREEELAAGHLLTMGYVSRRSELVNLDVERQGGSTRVAATLQSSEPAVVGPPEPLTPLERPLLAAETLHRAADITYSRGTLYNLTRGAHAAALFDFRGRLVEMAEDVGRYNAVDKVIGGRFLRGGRLDDLFLVVTCRVSLEMVDKVARSRMRVILTKAAPTDRAIEAAGRLALAVVHRDAQRALFTFSTASSRHFF